MWKSRAFVDIPNVRLRRIQLTVSIVALASLTFCQHTPTRSLLPQKSETSGYLGVHYVPGRSGIRIVSVFPGSPAARAGLRIGDEILSVNDHLMVGRYTFRSTIKALRKGELARMVVSRAESGEINITAEIDDLPKNLEGSAD